jgi:hypothetical protein
VSWSFIPLELWLLPQLLENKPNAVFQQDVSPLHIHYSINTFEYVLARLMDWYNQPHQLACAVTQSDAPQLLPLGLRDGRCVRTTTASRH